MTFTEAAVQVLRLVGKPLHYKEITDVAIEKELLSHVGKSPEVTMGARLAAVVKKGTDDNELVRVKPGVFALTEWDQATVDAGLQDRTPALKKLKKLEASQKAPADPAPSAQLELEAPAVAADSDSDADAEDEQFDETELFGADEADAEEEDLPEVPATPPRAEPTAVSVPVPKMDSLDADAGIGDDERARAELNAAGTEIFEAEDDDDEPILGGSSSDDDEDESAEDAGRRGRRRGRGRGRSRGGREPREDNDLPSYTVSDAADTPAAAQGSGPSASASSAGDDGGRDQGQRERAPRLDGLVGNGLADAVEQALAAHRRQGSASIKQLAEGGSRNGRSGRNGGQQPQQQRGESPQAQLILAAVRADGLRRVARGQRPRFRLLSGGRLALSEWSVDRDLLKLEREIQAQVRRYQEAATKVFAKRLAELPPRAQGELCLTVLERLGYSDFKAVKRPGANPSELHLSAVWSGPSGEVPAAVVIRRDGREIGRERVTELRGTLHHYEQAALGVIVSAGQVLSGAREEAAATGATPVHLIGGTTLATACEDQGLGVVTDTLRLHAPDAEFFEALRSGS